jgi:hypothetical protein
LTEFRQTLAAQNWHAARVDGAVNQATRAVVVALAIVLVVAGCGSTGARSATAKTSSVGSASATFSYVQYAALVIDDRAPLSVVAFGRILYAVHVTRTSAAVLRGSLLGSRYHFNTATDAAHYRQLGFSVRGLRPPLSTVRFRPGQYTFLPEAGRPLTYGAAQHLPTNAGAIEAAVISHIQQRPVSAATLVQAYGFLLAAAPLRRNSRVAIRDALVHLRGVENCGYGRSGLGQRGQVFCVVDGDIQTGVILAHDGRVLQIEQRLVRPDAVFPRVRPGEFILWDAFS